MKWTFILLSCSTAFGQSFAVTASGKLAGQGGSGSNMGLYDVYEITATRTGGSAYSNVWCDGVMSATFTDPLTGTHVIPGFYYSTAGSVVTYKVRFAPRAAWGTGTYSWTLSWDSNSVGSGSFAVTTGTNRGFLKVHSTNTYALITERDSKFFFGVGGPPQQGYGSPDNVTATFCYPNTSENTYTCSASSDTFFSTYSAVGGNLFRQNWEAVSGFVTDLDGTTGAGKFFGRSDKIDPLDDALKGSRNYDVHVLLTGDVDPAASFAGLGSSWSLTGTKQTAYLRYWTYWMARFGAFVDIWELYNESGNCNGSSYHCAASSFINTVAGHIRSTDPYTHLVSPGGFDATENANIQVNTPHHYDTSAYSALTDSLLNQPVNNNIGLNVAYAQSTDIPVIFGESGTQTSGDTCVHADLANEGRYRQWVWTLLMNQGAGVQFWDQSNWHAGDGAGCGNYYLGPITRGFMSVIRNFIDTYWDATAVPTSITVPSNTVGYAMKTTSTFYAAYIGSTNSSTQTITVSGGGGGATSTTIGNSIASRSVTVTVPSAGMIGRWISVSDGSIISTFYPASGSQALTIPSQSNEFTGYPPPDIALLLVSPVPADSSNHVSITEKNAATRTNYPVQFARGFKDGEIEHYPEAMYDCGAGVYSRLATQADVKQRWGSGYVKHAVISFLQPTLSSGATCTYYFQDQASGNNTALTKTEMLAGGFNFDATFTIGSNTVHARTMLTNDDYTLWTSGQIAQTIILTSHANSTTCNSHPCSTYDVGNDSNKSVRPIAHATFWPTINLVKVRFIGEIANTETLQDQTYNITLTIGDSSPVTVYTQTSVVHPALARWTVARNNQSAQTWSISSPSMTIRKELWIGGDPGYVNWDHGTAYLMENRFLPNYDLTRTVAPATDWTTWLSATSASINDDGLWTKAQGASGGRSDLGPFTTWNVRYLYSMDIRHREIVERQADLAPAWGYHLREGATGRIFNAGDSGNTGLGHVLSIKGRPYFSVSTPTTGTDSLTTVGTVGNFTGSSPSGWNADGAHTSEVQMPLYLMTGDFFRLEEAWFQAGRDANLTVSSYERAADGGSLMNQSLRTGAWGLRNRIEAAALTPDSLPEATYFTFLVNDGLAQQEGYYNITGTSFEGNSAWDQGRVNAGVWIPTSPSGMNPNPLHALAYPDAAFAGSNGAGYGLLSTVQKAYSLFEQHYMHYAVGRAEELGFAASALKAYVAYFYINATNDSNFNFWILGSGRFPWIDNGGAFISTWAGAKANYASSWQTATGLPASPNTGGWTSGLPPDDYMAWAGAGMSYDTDVTGGQTAWDTFDTNVFSNGTYSYANDPKWAIMPRDADACAISPTSTGPYTAGQSVSRTFSASGCSSSTWSTSGLSGSGLSINSSTGALTGTAVAGSYSAHILYDTADQPMTITVNAAPSITTSCPLTAGTVGSAYSVQFAATGGTSPLVWSNTGTLPTSLTFSASGLLSGTPTVANTFTPTFVVTDGNSITDSKTSCSITINASAGAPKMSFGGGIGVPQSVPR